MSEPTPAQARYLGALREAVTTAQALAEAERHDRLAGLSVALDIGVSCAFMFMVNDRAYDDAANLIRQALDQATRP